jgi:hypothetical protein
LLTSWYRRSEISRFYAAFRWEQEKSLAHLKQQLVVVREDRIFFAAVMPEEGASTDACAGGDLVNGGLGVALRSKELGRGAREALPRIVRKALLRTVRNLRIGRCGHIATVQPDRGLCDGFGHQNGTGCIERWHRVPYSVSGSLSSLCACP